MTFLELSQIFEKIENTSSRNDMTSIIVDAISKLDEVEVQIFSYLIGGRVAPLFVPAEYNFSEKGIINALEIKYGDRVLNARKRVGDIGNAVESVLDAKGGNISVKDIYEVLWQFVNAKGSGSIEKKSSLYVKTVSELSALEARYFSRIVVGDLRLGSSAKTVLDAFSFVLVGDKSLREKLDHAYGSSADLGYIASLVKKKNAMELIEKVVPTPGVPVLSRLVERVKSFDEAGERFPEEFFVQPKYDGLRCQIHKIPAGYQALKDRIWNDRLEDGGNIDMFSTDSAEIKLFTRNLEDVTDMFPEIVQAAKSLPIDSFILDSEIVGWDSKKKKFRSYQDTMTRRRKYGIQGKSEDIPVNAFAFDVISLSGKSLLGTTTDERFKLLNNLLLKVKSDIQLSPCDKVKGVNQLRDLFDKYVGMGLEGVIVKDVNSGYTPGVRDFEWVKIKKSIDSDLVDTVDLVVIGYYLGSGKRAKFGIGAILGAVYNSEEERFESMTKIGTGITDDQWTIIKKRLGPLEVSERPHNVVAEDILKPDVWIKPEVVITVDADEVSLNRGGQAIAGGLSLRFPRLVEFDRDKLPEDATTVEELKGMRK